MPAAVFLPRSERRVSVRVAVEHVELVRELVIDEVVPVVRPMGVAQYAIPGQHDRPAVIKMDWVLKFARAKEVFDNLIAARIWANPAAQKEIARMLRKRGLLDATPQSLPFGNLDWHIQLLDMDYINQRVVSFGLSDLDDLSAALGNFAFRVAVAGGVTFVSGSKHRVSVNEVAVYVRDSFDFNGDQFLGFWDDSDNSVSMVNPLSGTSITNASFRDWRAKNGRGGDFLVFSDSKRLRLPSPDEFEV